MRFTHIALLLSLALTSCGRVKSSTTNQDDGEAMTAAFMAEKSIQENWRAAYGEGARGARTNRTSLDLRVYTEQAKNAARALIQSHGTSSTVQSSNSFRRVKSGERPLPIVGALNTYYPQFSEVKLGAVMVSGAGAGVLLATFVNAPPSGYYLRTGVPIIYPVPTGIPAFAFLGLLEASGNGSSSKAVAAAYADASVVAWGISSPEFGTRGCLIELATGSYSCLPTTIP